MSVEFADRFEQDASPSRLRERDDGVVTVAVVGGGSFDGRCDG